MRRPFPWTLAFSCAGHTYVHLFTAFYFVIVIALEAEWHESYAGLIELWTLGALLVGVAALPAGWLGDRWSASGMMGVFFVGMGACSMAAGLTDGPRPLMLALAGIGLFASIYHPVGIPWLVRSARHHRGKLLAVNGIFGSLGAALAGLVAGVLIDVAGWRAAFVVPGIVSTATGIALFACRRRGLIVDHRRGPDLDAAVQRTDFRRVFAVLMLTMFCGGIIFHAVQTVLPKLFAVRAGGLIGQGAFEIGLLVAVVYTAAGVMQLVGGYLADRFALKPLYIGAFLCQAPLLWLAGGLDGLPLVVTAALMVMVGISALPAENMLLAYYTPSRRHGVVFGIKFVLAFGTAPLAVQMVSKLSERTGEFGLLFSVLALTAWAVAVAALWLPGSVLRPQRLPLPAD